MRGRELAIRLVAVFALVTAFLPAGAIAALCAPAARCEMACCRPAPRVKASGHGCCPLTKAKKTDRHSLSADDGCRCEIRSVPTHPQPPAVAPTPIAAPEIYAIVESAAFAPPALGAEPASALTPGVVGTDSGPPISRPRCVRASRAPPVNPA